MWESFRVSATSLRPHLQGAWYYAGPPDVCGHCVLLCLLAAFPYQGANHQPLMREVEEVLDILQAN